MSQPESGTRGARSQSRRLAVIDGLRGVAILAVMSQHSLARYTGPGSELLGVGSAALPVWAPLSNGWLGVSLFCVLSGFVLYASGARQMVTRPGRAPRHRLSLGPGAAAACPT